MARTAIPATLDHFNDIKNYKFNAHDAISVSRCVYLFEKAAGIPVLPAHLTCADPGSFVRGGPTLTTFFMS